MHLSCQACGDACQPDSPSCPGCKALYYCSLDHMRLHTRHAHGPDECRRMAEQLKRAQTLTEHGMPWPVQSLEEVGSWLTDLDCQEGMLQQGWQSHCNSLPRQPASGPISDQACSSASGSAAGNPAAHAWLPTNQEQWQQAWGLPDPALVPAWQTGPELQQLQPADSWRQYYDSRGLPHSSPAALVLHYVLTLWHCLVSILPRHGWHLPPKGQAIHIAYLGPKGELAMLPAFAELAMLLPDHQLHIHFIGPDIPEQLHQQTCRSTVQEAGPQQQQAKGVLQVSCWSSCFHDVLADWTHERSSPHTIMAQQAPTANTQQWVAAAAPARDSLHLIFCANAGLPAYASWRPSLQELARMAPDADCQCSAGKVHAGAGASGSAATAPGCADSSGPVGTGTPVMFSDYCEEAACMSEQLVQQLLGKAFSLPCALNPFRDPVPATAHGTRLPACSNGFVFGWL